MTEATPYRATEELAVVDFRNFVVKRYHQTWFERQFAKVERLICRLLGGDAIKFEPPFCWKCDIRWPDLDRLWACPGVGCSAIDEKAKARWDARERKSSGGSALPLLMLAGAAALLLSGRK